MLVYLDLPTKMFYLLKGETFEYCHNISELRSIHVQHENGESLKRHPGGRGVAKNDVFGNIFLNAAHKGHVEVVRFFLSKGVDRD